MKEKRCNECGAIFYSKAHNAKYCSKECKLKGSKKNHILKCENCNKEFSTDKLTKRFCSLSCSSKFNAKPKTIKKCTYCEKDFHAYKKKMMFCSKECRGKFESESNRVEVNCDYCGKIFTKTRKQFERSDRHYCSHYCRGKHQSKTLLGKNNPNFKDKTIVKQCSNCNSDFYMLECNLKNSDGTIKKNIYCSAKCKGEHQKTILQGNCNPNYRALIYNCSYCGKEIERTSNYARDKKYLFCSQKCKNSYQSEFIRGEHNPNYDKNKPIEERIIQRQYAEYNDWRKQVYERDKYTCQCCKDNKGGNLHAHHILNYSQYDKLRTNVDNGITLCESCHKLFHKKYGNQNNNREQLDDFFNSYKF